MLYAALIFYRWAADFWASRWGPPAARGQPVPLSIRDSYIIAVAFSVLICGLAIGGAIHGVEVRGGASPAYVDCLYQAASALSSTGLIALDTSKLQAGSNILLFFSMLVFANTMLVTQVPVVLRILRVRASIAARDAKAAELDARSLSLNAEAVRAAQAAAEAAAQREERRLLEWSQQSKAQFPSARAPLPSFLPPGRDDGAPAAAAERGAAAAPPARPPPRPRGGPLGTPSERSPPPLGKEAAAGVPAEAAAYYAARAQHDAHARALAAFLAQPDYLGYHYCLALGVGYYATIVLAGFVAFCAWGTASASARELLERNATPAGSTSLPWFSVFHSLSLFTNSGLMMVTDNMMQFGWDPFFVVTSGVIAALGFSYYPLGFRLFALAARAAMPRGGEARRAVDDLLEHPRKYTSHLFSKNGTYALVYASLAMQALLFLVHLCSDFDAAYFVQRYPRPEDRAMNGWFASLMVYNAGFNTFDLSFMSQGQIVFIVCCMWLTGRPFFLGILATAEEEGAGGGDEPVVHHHHRGLKAWQAVRNDFFATLTTDAWVCAACLALICFADSGLMAGGAISGPTPALGTLSYIGIVPVVFDLSSAYGNVGLSLGYPNTPTASTAVLSPFSKLVVVFMMMHGC